MSKEKELILEAKHVTKKFPLTKGKELIANDDVSLKFYKGQTLGIVGESGCGKSTFMRMMVQLEQPTSGEILFKGKDITKMKGEELRKNRRNGSCDRGTDYSGWAGHHTSKRQGT